MDKGQCQNFWARNSEFGLYPYFLWGARKERRKIGVLERCQKSVLVIVGGGMPGGWLADTCGSYRGLDLRCAANCEPEGETVARRWPHARLACSWKSETGNWTRP